MSRMFLEHLAASDPAAEHVVIQDQAGFHLNPELHKMPIAFMCCRCRPTARSLAVEAIGDLIKDRIGNTL